MTEKHRSTKDRFGTTEPRIKILNESYEFDSIEERKHNFKSRTWAKIQDDKHFYKDPIIAKPIITVSEESASQLSKSSNNDTQEMCEIVSELPEKTEERKFKLKIFSS